MCIFAPDFKSHLMKPRNYIFIALLSALFVSCFTLQPVSVVRNTSMDKYKYFYVTPTESKTGSAGSVFGYNYGVYGSSTTKSTNPADIISGYLMKQGLIRLPEIKKELAEQTMVINYGETDRRPCGFGYSIEVTIQIISAQTSEVICVLTGDGMGETEADDIRIAIERCLDELYKR